MRMKAVYNFLAERLASQKHTTHPFMGDFSADDVRSIVMSKIQAGIPSVLYRVESSTFSDIDTGGYDYTENVRFDVYYAENSMKTSEFPELLPDVLTGAMDVNKRIVADPAPKFDINRVPRITQMRVFQNDANGTIIHTQFEIPGINFDYDEL